MIELKRLNKINDFKSIEYPTSLSRFVLEYKDGKSIRAKWTVNKPLLLEKESGEIVIVTKWFINRNNELIWSTRNDFFNLGMYDGTKTPKSFIINAYKIERG